MRKWMSSIGIAAVLLGATAMAPRAHASSHREALAILNDPCVDNTDVYAWVTPGTHDKLYLIAGYNGLHEPGQGNQQTRLCDDVLYEFHIARGIGVLDDAVTYQIQFSSTPPTQNTPGQPCADITNCGTELLVQQGGVKQTYTVTKVENGVSTVLGSGLSVTPPNVGPQTDRLIYGLGPFKGYDANDPASHEEGLYDDAFAARYIHALGTNGAEGRAWTGTRDDGFYLDEKGIFDVINLAGLPGGRRSPGEDVFAGFNLNVIALEIPTSKVTGTGQPPAHNKTPGDDTLLGVWASASRKRDRRLEPNGEVTSCGPWVQVGREGLPLVDAGLIGVQDQSKYLRTTPRTDVENFAPYFLSPTLVRDAEALGIYKALGVPDSTVSSLKNNRVDILKTINLDDIPTPGAHHVPIEPGKTGDVLRVDIATDSHFPNGRSIPGGSTSNREQVDVSDTLLTVILSGGAILVGDGVNHNDKDYLTEFPWLALPHQGLNEGHGAVAP
ncbi:MAG: DUF4331 domain-containing protein [Deltaproteobacteria bacterium]|nr:DUF4331 domain-containing protein [Deltaproteobacteria bacterium]